MKSQQIQILYESDNSTSKYIKLKLIELKRKAQEPTVIILKIQCSCIHINRSSRQKLVIQKTWTSLTTKLTGIYINFSITAQYTFFKFREDLLIKNLFWASKASCNTFKALKSCRLCRNHWKSDIWKVNIFEI